MRRGRQALQWTGSGLVNFRRSVPHRMSQLVLGHLRSYHAKPILWKTISHSVTRTTYQKLPKASTSTLGDADEAPSGHFGEDDDEGDQDDQDDDDPSTGLALATHMREAGGNAGQRGTD
ncbi:hypothetical protein CF327_g1592 [Tilletia walkeri]|uniref:Uncharacterized protein n=1 Tax=Tilletia walkeri TaxID=117179 RepID=A0A8X7N3K8_9BASI|nr:hypothetical protein CF327_g1592 [Tilletia walkeri]KAE8262742.1 hypothetical protein A4X09_0g7395 [Tilletia walkeri]